MQKQIIVFEEIFPLHRWIIRWYFFKKKEVYYFRLNRRCKSTILIKKYINRDLIKKINLDFRLNTFEGRYYDLAFDNIEKLFTLFRNNTLLNLCKRLYGSDSIELAFKKTLNVQLSRFYYLNYSLNRIQKVYLKEQIVFIPSNGIEVYRSDGCEIYDYFKFRDWAKRTGTALYEDGNVKFPFWAIIISYLNAAKRKLKIFAQIVGFCFLVLAASVKKVLFKNRLHARHYKYAIMIISPLRQFANRIQRVDFLIDGDTVKKEESVFLSYQKLNRKNAKYLEINGLNYIDDFDIFISGREIAKVFPVYLFLLLCIFTKDTLMTETGLKLIYSYLRWKGLTKNIKLDNLITYCDFGMQSIARNIILKHKKCITYYYMDSTNFGWFFKKIHSDILFRHNLFGFLYYDYFICWNNEISNYFKSCKAQIKEYINLGCFWSEHLREIKEDRIKSDLKNRLYDYGYNDGMKLVSVFDSTFHDDSLTTYEDGIKFLEAILILLNDMPNIFVVLKEKKAQNYHKKITSRFNDILELYDNLRNHPRCFLSGNKENASEIMAFSDLTISFPFTSTTFEALSARKRAIWYDATDKFRETFCDAVPGLVCHNYEELLKRVKELLFGISEEKYNQYLDCYVRGRVEPYLDGRAISRFRKLLVNGKV